MANILKHNITLKRQVNHVFSKTLPESKSFLGYSVSVDNSDSEEYSFSGTKEQIDAQEEAELAAATFTPVSGNSEEEKQVIVGKSVTTTKTRIEGSIWVLNVKISNIIQTISATEAEKKDKQEKKFGSKTNPKIVNTNVSAIQQSILFKEPYKNWSPEELGALKQYINGASPLTRIPKGLDSSGNPKNAFLSDILDYNKPEVAQAIKTPVYYVPSVNITISYWSETPVSNMGNIGQQQNPSAGNFQIAPGYISVFMGASSSPADGGGYQIQETYSIGQYNPTMLSAGGNSGGTTGN